MKKFSYRLFSGLFIFFIPISAFAHEAYVLSHSEFQRGLATPNVDFFAALKNPGNLNTFLIIAVGIVILFVLNFIFRRSRAGRALDRILERGSKFGPFIVRLAISAAFFFSALFGSFLGPELSLADLPYGFGARTILFFVSFLFLTGFLTEIAALLAFAVYVLAVSRFGLYMATYLNYVGELLVLLLLGFRYFSIDGLVFGAKRGFAILKKYESAIVRICYGLSLCYSAIFVKLLHPSLPMAVVTNYHLTDFFMMFPHDPTLVAFGAALAELTIGLFIIFGFELRLTVFISLIYITLSLLYFRELVWPHLMLYGISLNLIFSKETFTLDGFFDKFRFKN